MLPSAPWITIIGSANIDLVMSLPRLPTLGESVSGGVFQHAFGGKGANQAVAASRAGAQVGLVGALGDDAYASEYHEHLKKEGLDLKHLHLETGVPTGTALIMINEQGENYLAIAAGANARVTPDRVTGAGELIERSAWIILQQEIPHESNLRALELAQKAEVPVMLNYAPATGESWQPGARVHALVVNETEASVLSGKAVDSAERAREVALELLQTGGHRLVVVTLGEKGVIAAADDGSVEFQKAFAVKAVDTTSAGDTFCGFMAVALAQGRDLRESLRIASGASALAVTKLGAQPSIPRMSEVEAFLVGY